MSFGDRLRVTRKEKGLSQEQLAEELDVSRQSVTKWETGITFPEIKTMLRLASLLDKDLDWLLYDEKPNSTDLSSRHKAFTRMSIVPDRDALNSIMKHDLIISMMDALDGYEIIREVESDEFTGTQTCIFYKGRAFTETTGTEPDNTEAVTSFSEMSLSEIEALLLPWNTIRRSKISALPQVAKNAP